MASPRDRSWPPYFSTLYTYDIPSITSEKFAYADDLAILHTSGEQLVGGTELEDSQKQRFHISRSFSSDTCQGNRQNKECRAETAYNKSAREKREIVSDWTKSVDQSKTEALVRDFQRVDKLLLPAQDWSRNFDVSGF